MEQINANNRIAVLLCIAAAIVAIAVGILTSRWIAKPIRDLSEASAKMSDGKLTQTVKAKGVEELETLAQSFNRMSHRLNESFETLERKNADLKQTGDALAIAKEQLEAILNAVPGSISWIDSEGRYIGVNEYLAQMLNLSREEIIGREVGFVDNSPEFTTFIRQFLANSEPFSSRVIAIRVGDRTHYYLMAARKYQQGNAAVTVGIDITERKKAEEALRIAEENYRSIFENALEGIFQSSVDGHFISVNPAMAQIYGYDSPQEMLDRVTAIATQIYVNPDDQQEFKRRLQRDGQVKNFEYQVYQKDGRIIWIEEDTRSVRDSQGNILYYEGIIQDISQRKRDEEDLKRQIQELKIEIDQQKREKDVAEITESDYFKELQMTAESLRFDDDDW